MSRKKTTSGGARSKKTSKTRKTGSGVKRKVHRRQGDKGGHGSMFAPTPPPTGKKPGQSGGEGSSKKGGGI